MCNNFRSGEDTLKITAKKFPKFHRHQFSADTLLLEMFQSMPTSPTTACNTPDNGNDEVIQRINHFQSTVMFCHEVQPQPPHYRVPHEVSGVLISDLRFDMLECLLLWRSVWAVYPRGLSEQDDITAQWCSTTRPQKGVYVDNDRSIEIETLISSSAMKSCNTSITFSILYTDV